MKKHLTILIPGLLLALILFTGCKKKDNDSSGPSKPDISSFSVTAQAPYVTGSKGTLQVTSTSLAAGVYTVQFSCTGENRFSNQVATLVMNDHIGTFQTPILDTVLATYVTLDSITNSDGLTAVFTGNNFATLTDTTGIMIATIGGGGAFRAVAVFPDTSGMRLGIDGMFFLPNSTDAQSIYIFTSSYNNTPGAYSFTNQYFGGGAVYEVRTGSTVTDNNALYGTLNIVTASPVLSGTFLFTCIDSTKISGTFSCLAL